METSANISALDHDIVDLVHVAFKVLLDEPASDIRYEDVHCELHGIQRCNEGRHSVGVADPHNNALDDDVAFGAIAMTVVSEVDTKG